jgi:hypothetical protein
VAKEIYQAWTAAGTLYALVRQPSDNFVWDPSIATPAFVSWVDGNIANYDIPMTATGRVHLADFPVLITTAGTYDVFIMLQATGTPAITDTFISQGQICWDGTAEIVLSTIDTNVDTLITNQGKVNNVIQTIELPEGSDKARIFI